MVTTKSMRTFSLDCLRWADQTPNPSHRQTILSVARTWLKTAEAIDHTVADGGDVLPDLKFKLN